MILRLHQKVRLSVTHETYSLLRNYTGTRLYIFSVIVDYVVFDNQSIL